MTGMLEHDNASDSGRPPGRWRNRMFAVLVVGALSMGSVLVLAPNATADPGAICGQEVIPAAQPYNLTSLAQDLSAYNQDELSEIVSSARLGHWACEPAAIAQEIGVHVLIGGIYEDIFSFELNGGLKVTVAAAEVWADRLPDVGGSGEVQAPVAWTGGEPLNLRTEPGGAVLTSIPEGATVTILCAEAGPAWATDGSNDSWWDTVSYAGFTGSVADSYLDTSSDYPVVPICS